MDKTFNDLVDIVHRTKKINGKDESKLSSARLNRRVSNTEVVEHDIVEDTGDKKSKMGLKGASAISSFLEKGKSKAATKKPASKTKISSFISTTYIFLPCSPKPPKAITLIFAIKYASVNILPKFCINIKLFKKVKNLIKKKNQYFLYTDFILLV